jgi:hypothetical protein
VNLQLASINNPVKGIAVVAFADVLKLLPKAWSKPGPSSDEEDLERSGHEW